MAEDEMSPPTGAHVLRVSAGRVWRQDEIIHEVIERPNIELADVRGLVQAIIELANGDLPTLLLADIRKVRWATNEARAYAASREMQAVGAAHAVLVGSPVSRMVGSFFMRVHSPPFPIRLFTAPREARAWLRKQSSAAAS